MVKQVIGTYILNNTLNSVIKLLNYGEVMKLKIGTVAWGWFDDPENTQTKEFLYKVIKEISALKFDTVDLIGTRDSLANFYNDEMVSDLRNYIKSVGLEMSTFVSSTPNLNHPDEEERERVLDDFRKATEVAAKLGAKFINCTVPIPQGVIMKRNGAAADKFTVIFPENYSWEEDWNTYVNSMKRCVKMATDKDLKMSIECFPYTINSTPHAWLKILEEIDSPNFGIQLDTAHLVNQRHDVITAIHMLGGKNIFNIHCKDSDGMTRGNLPPGSGIIDYSQVVKTLRKVGYQGALTVEVEFTREPGRYAKQGRDHLLKVLEENY